MFPAVVVVHAPVARMSKHPPTEVEKLTGAVIVAIAVVPVMTTKLDDGAIVVAEATVTSADAPTLSCPQPFGPGLHPGCCASAAVANKSHANRPFSITSQI